MKALFLVLIAVSAAHAEMPKPEPQLWPNNHEYIIELNGKRTPILIYRRVGDYGQVYEARLPERIMMNDICLYGNKTTYLDMSKTKVIKEIFAEDKNPALDFVDPETTPNAIRYYRWKAGAQ
jgi:hypothetical protein